MAVATLCSCSSEEIAVNSEQLTASNGVEFSAVNEEIDGGVASRTTLNTYLTPEWIANTDKVSINGAEYTAQSSGTKTTFTGTGAEKDSEGKYHVYYPTSLYNSGTPTLPSTWDYADGKFNMPMYAESETTELSFYNICGVVAVKVTSEEMSKVTGISVSCDKAICGAFTITTNSVGKYQALCTGTDDASKTVTLNCGDGVTPKSKAEGGTTFYIPLSVTSGAKLYITVHGDPNATKAASYSPFVYTQSVGYKNVSVLRNTIYNRTFASSLSYFSVSPRTKVNFTNGNLWSDSNGNLSLETSQTACPAEWDAEHVGHFYWTVKKEKSYVYSYDLKTKESDSDIPWFAPFVEVGGTSGLRVLTGGTYSASNTDGKGEWYYLVNNRAEDISSLIAIATVTNGTESASNNLIIAPDNFVGTLKSSYTEEELKWYGLLCLPAAGAHQNNMYINPGIYGYYISATTGGFGIYNLNFDSSSVEADGDGARYGALAIRLVKNGGKDSDAELDADGNESYESDTSLWEEY